MLPGNASSPVLVEQQTRATRALVEAAGSSVNIDDGRDGIHNVTRILSIEGDGDLMLRKEIPDSEERGSEVSNKHSATSEGTASASGTPFLETELDQDGKRGPDYSPTYSPKRVIWSDDAGLPLSEVRITDLL